MTAPPLDTAVIPSQRSATGLTGPAGPPVGAGRESRAESLAIAAAVEMLADLGSPARLANMRLQHRDDGHGRCTGCATSDGGGPVWPCTLLGIALAALPLAMARPVLPSQPPGQGRHGVCVTCAAGKTACPAHPRRPRR